MRVITGKARGTKLELLPGMETRPTTDKIKEAIFSVVHFDLPGAHVLDLCAGTGQMGVEALSREASFCVFIDKNRHCQNIILNNLKKTHLEKQARVAAMDAVSYLKTTHDHFDVVFFDPPYDAGICDECLTLLGNKVNKGGLVVCESHVDEKFSETIGELIMRKFYVYGQTKVTIFEHNGKEF